MEKNGHRASERRPPVSLYSFYPPLYAIPPQQPLPLPLPLPCASSPSPYIVKHKRRGPRQSVSEHQRTASDTSGRNASTKKESSNDRDVDDGGAKASARSAWLEQEGSSDMFEMEINDGEALTSSSLVSSSTSNEFFDAQEVSSEEGSQDVFEKPMIPHWQEAQAEAALLYLDRQSDAVAQKLFSLALSFTSGNHDGNRILQELANVFEHYCQELIVTRLVHTAIARGAARANKEEELETLLACKNKEIARLRDKLQYFEIVNHEMSQRSQEAVEIAQRRRRRHRKRQKWVLSFITGAVLFGTAVLVIYEADKYWNLRLGSLISSHLSTKQVSCPKSGEQCSSCTHAA